MAKKKSKKGARTERRFVPQSTVSPTVTYGLGAAGAIGLGAGAISVFGNGFRDNPVTPWAYGTWILAGGAIVSAIAIWFATSGEAAVRVGQAGIAEDRGENRRIPWWAVESIADDAGILIVRGANDAGEDLTIKISMKAFATAIPWILKEGRHRAKSKVMVSDEIAAKLGPAIKDEGEVVDCPPLQVVGKRCSESEKVISFEPDARVCPRCERIYHKAHVPKKCECGMALDELRAKKNDPEDDTAEET